MSPSVPTLGSVLVGTPKAGDTHKIDVAADYVHDVELDADQYSSSVRGAASQLLDAESRSVRRIQAKLADRLLPGADAVQQSAARAETAFKEYSAEVHRIHADADRIRSGVRTDAETLAEAITTVEEISRAIGVTAEHSWRDVPPGALPQPQLGPIADGLLPEQREAAEHSLRGDYEQQWLFATSRWQAAVASLDFSARQWANLIDERGAAEGRLVRALEDTPIGHLISLSSREGVSAKRTIALAVSGEVWGRVEAGALPAVSHPLLEKLIGTRDGSSLMTVDLSPALVSQRWRRLSDDEQEALIAEVPWVIGNLPGLDAAVRDRANRAQLDFYRAHPQLLDLEQLKLAGELQRILTTEAEQIADRGLSQPPIQVLALDLNREVPGVAVVYGDADTSRNTTWVVPGMDNDAANGLFGLDLTSSNLFDAQGQLTDAARENAVIAWLGYDTPGRPDEFDLSVLASAKAHAGAVRLAAELDGLHAARTEGESGGASVGVLAHSYGTTTASIALTLVDHPVDSFVMLGSAGLDTALVPTFEVLRVAEVEPGQRAIYTTQAAGDMLAPAGAALGGRGQPNPDAETIFGLQNHSPVYGGALSFSSEGNPDQGLLQTDGHSLIGEGLKPGLFGVSASEGHGYADKDTQSLMTIARITTGTIDELPADSFVRTEAEQVVYRLDLRSGMPSPRRVRVE